MKPAILRNRLLLAMILFVLWLLLTSSLATDELITGFILAVTISLLFKRIELLDGFILTWSSPLALIRFVFYFIVALIKANLDLARRILTPSLPLNPAMVEIQTRLKSDLGKLLLANSITLTPGTLTVDVTKDRFLVHWVDTTPGTDIHQATQAIAAEFEKHIRGFMS